MSQDKSARVIVSNAFRQWPKHQQATADRKTLVIRGGKFDAPQLPGFLESWRENVNAAMPWSIVERVNTTYISHPADLDELIAHASCLERCRVFGLSGDLDLRRDGRQLYWRFIGEPNPNWPKLDNYNGEDFWKQHGEHPGFSTVAKLYYQWNIGFGRVSHRWREGTGLPTENVYLRQIHYLNGAHVSFVRFIEFTTRQEQKGGDRD